MFWKLLQIFVFFAVAFTGIHYQWTPNGLVLGIVAGFAAFGVTVLLGDLFRFLSWLRFKARAVLAHQGQNKSLPRGR